MCTVSTGISGASRNPSLAKSLFRLAFAVFDNLFPKLYKAHFPPRLYEAASKRALRGPLAGFAASARFPLECTGLNSLILIYRKLRGREPSSSITARLRLGFSIAKGLSDQGWPSDSGRWR